MIQNIEYLYVILPYGTGTVKIIYVYRSYDSNNMYVYLNISTYVQTYVDFNHLSPIISLNDITVLLVRYYVRIPYTNELNFCFYKLWYRYGTIPYLTRCSLR